MIEVIVAVVLTALVTAGAVWLVVRANLRAVEQRVTDATSALAPDLARSGPGVALALDDLDRAAHEIATRRSDEEAAHQRLVNALEAIPHGVVVVDAAGQTVFTNQTGSLYSSARHGEALVEAAMREMLAQAIRGERGIDTVELYGPPRRFIVITAVPFDPSTSGLGAVAVIDDVTERRRLEAVRRDFVSNISHELKTPIGALALLAETLTDETDREVASRLAHRIYKEAHRVARTIDDLLELSRIEAEESPQREVIEVAALLIDAVERMRPAAEQKEISLDLRRPHPTLRLEGDGRQLVSAVFNLLENAVKYSDSGSSVEVWAGTDGRVVDVSVRDHGMGIPSRDVDRVFERFYRVDQARSRQTGGTGLGLAIVRHVVNNHGGGVLVDSVEGEGSTFTLRFPVGTGSGPVLLGDVAVDEDVAADEEEAG